MKLFYPSRPQKENAKRRVPAEKTIFWAVLWPIQQEKPCVFLGLFYDDVLWGGW
jgi:hypothetical protein